MTKPTSITDLEITARITAALHAEAAYGKKPSDMGRDDVEKIFDVVKDQFSPAARRQLIYEGVLTMVQRVLGEKIAEVVWKNRTGWPSNPADIENIGRRLNFDDPKEAVTCAHAFRDHISDLRFSELESFKLTGRFAPLFIGQPETATLGEIATVKAARGDKLALSFLAWKEIA